jgi:S1-C subfamily serine protease
VSVISHLKTRNLFDQTLDNVASGSGFFITADGLVATNKHVIDGANTISVLTQDGKQYDAKLVDTDPLNDFAILRIDAKNLPVVELGYSDQLKIGEQVIAIGNALGSYDNTVTSGILSGINRTIVASSESSADSSQLEGLLQVDAPINQGNSGGPLVNLTGQVIGINTAVDKSGEGIGFAIPINDLRPAIESAIAKGKIIRPLLGVRYINITPELKSLNKLPSDKGALVTAGQNSKLPAVVPDGPAAKAGIKDGDIILTINDVEITKDKSLIRALSKFNPGDAVSVTFLRDSKKQSVKVTLGQANNK